MNKLTAVGIVALLSLAACAAQSSDDDATSGDEQDITRKPAQAQMNDVSVLFPMAKSKAEMAGYLTADALIPSALYTSATGEPLTPPKSIPVGADAGLVYNELKVVAFRVDPCFANLGPVTPDTQCDNQLRLILQPLSFGDGATTASAFDGGIHAFYSISRDDLVALTKSLIAIRQKASGSKALGALAVHPLLAQEGLLGDTAKAMNALLTQYASPKNLVRFTMLKPGNLATTWTFRGFDIANNKSTAMVIPSLPDKTTSVMFFAGFASDLAGGFTPPTQSKDSMQILGNLANAQKATKDDQQAAIDAAVKIENPTMHSPNTIDCASCHVAGPSSIRTGASLGLTTKGNVNTFQRNTKLVSAADMKQTTPIDDDTRINFHAFSYRDTFPMVSLRVINETASVVAFLNGNYLK